MRIVLIGQRWLGLRMLELLRRRGYAVAGVVAPASDKLALAGGLIEMAAAPALEPDLIICAHAHVYIPAAVIAAARLGVLGYHPSLLPLHRGRDAIAWALRMGDRITGGTVYWLDGGVDTGPVAAQEWCFIRPDDTARSLWQRDLGPMGLRLFGRVLDDIARGRIIRQPQDPLLASWEPRLHPPPLRNSA